MKKLLLSVALLSPMALLAQSDFTIKGKTKTVADGSKIYLIYAEKGQLTVDSAIVTKGAFAFKGKVGTPVIGNLFKNVNPYKKGANTKNMDYTALYVEAGNTVVNSVDSLKSAIATGAPVNTDNSKLNALLKPLFDKESAIMSEYNALTDEQKKDKATQEVVIGKLAEVRSEKTPIYLKFISDNTKSYISLVQLNNLVSDDKTVADAERLYPLLAKELKEMPAGKAVVETLAALKKTAVGVQAANFTQNDQFDKPVSLSDFKGKYVLIDFWASWCGPCRQENPNVVEAYTKFKDKNFTILGVSLDGGSTRTTKEAWLKAVEDDKLTWTQVSDLNGWDNEVSKAWGIKSIPANYLIDPTGKIIAKNLRGEELQTKLAELLK